MKKLKLLLIAAALLLGGGLTNAKTDVTATYLTNADFEGEYSVYSYPQSDRAIYQPSGWDISYSEGDVNDMSALDSDCLQWNETFKSKPQLGNAGGGKTYWIRFRWGNKEQLTLSQTVKLPAGYYTLSADAFFNGANGASATISAGGKSTNIIGNSTWGNFKVEFSLNSETETTISFSLKQTQTVENIAAFDNFTLTWTDDPLESFKEDLKAEIDRAKLCDAKEGLAGAIATAENVLATATTEQELTDALAALQAADKDALLRYDNNLADATYANPIVTGFVVNGTFDSNIDGWSREGDYFQNNKRQTGKNAPFSGGFYENWTPSAANLLNKMYQTISNIPNGTYRLDICAFVNNLAAPNESQFVFANDDKTYLTAGDPTSYEVYTVVTNNQIVIGLQQTTSTANWMAIDNVSLRYYGAGDVINAAKNASHKLAWEEALAAAKAAIEDDNYANVTGSERSELEVEIAKSEPSDAQGYDAAADALNTKKEAFTAAKASYDALVTVNGLITTAGTLKYADAGKKPSADVTATSATDADAKTASQYAALRAYYESHALAESVEGAVNMSSVVEAANAATNSGWTNGIGTNQGQGYTDSQGNIAGKYLDGGWAANAACNIDMTRAVDIPAGKYLLTVKARGAENLTEYTLSIGGETINLPHANGGSNGVFGNGWEDASIEFEADGTIQTLEVVAKSEFSQQWMSMNDFRLVQLEINNAIIAAQWESLKEECSPLLNNEDYNVIIGSERTRLINALNAEPTGSDYNEAIEELKAARDAFIAAKPDYELLAVEKEKAAALGMTTDEINNAAATTKTGLKATQDLKVAEYEFVTTNYQYGVELGEWTSVGENTKAAKFSNEHWSGETREYMNQDDSNGQGWNASSWSINFSQDVSLPAGSYVFKVAGRQASGDQVNTSLVVKQGDNELGSVSDFPRSNKSRGINKVGETAFEGENSEFANGGLGFGWEWRYVKFTLASDATVNIAVNAVATAKYQWVSFGDYTLQSDNEATIALVGYNIAFANAQATLADEAYANVGGAEKKALEDAIAADGTLNKNSKTDVEAATTALNEAANTFKAAKEAYDAFAEAKTAATTAQNTESDLMKEIATVYPLAPVTYDKIVVCSEGVALAGALQAAEISETTEASALNTETLTLATASFLEAVPAYERAQMTVILATLVSQQAKVSNIKTLLSATTTTKAADLVDPTNDAITALVPLFVAKVDKKFGFEKDEYAPYTNVEGVKALLDAQAIGLNPADYDNNAIYQSCKTILSYQWTKNTDDMDAIYNGDMAIPNGNNPKGWTRSNNAWGQQITGIDASTGASNGTAWYYNTNGAWVYGNDGGYLMPLAANTKYVLTFKYRSHENNSNNYMKVSVLNGEEGLAPVTFPANKDKTNFVTAKAYFTTGAAGNYILSLEQNGNTHLTDVSLVKAESTTFALSEEATTAPAELAYYEEVKLTRTLNGGKWNTFSVPFDMAVPEGWTVKEYDAVEGNVMTFKEANSIVAGKPYIVKPTVTVANPTYEGVVVKATEGVAVGEGYQFVAQIYNKPLDGIQGTIVYLSATDGSLKKLSANGSIKGLRAYFIIPAGAELVRIVFDDGSTTGISEIGVSQESVEGIYDMNGRRVQSMKKGVYVVNGKKVIK